MIKPGSNDAPRPAASAGGAPHRRPVRDTWGAVRRGARLRCPACGIGAMFGRYLKVNDHCPSCGEALHHQRADDAPPYITIVIVGHIVVPLVLTVERHWQPPEWVHAVLWLPLTLALVLAILPVAKGALIGLQWAHRLDGFNETVEPEAGARPMADQTRGP